MAVDLELGDGRQGHPLRNRDTTRRPDSAGPVHHVRAGAADDDRDDERPVRAMSMKLRGSGHGARITVPYLSKEGMDMPEKYRYTKYVTICDSDHMQSDFVDIPSSLAVLGADGDEPSICGCHEDVVSFLSDALDECRTIRDRLDKEGV